MRRLNCKVVLCMFFVLASLTGVAFANNHALSEDVLKNANYGSFKLKNGEYADANGRIWYACSGIGDVVADGTQYVAVVLSENLGGSGVFRTLYLFKYNNEKLKLISSKELGQMDIKKVTVNKQKIAVIALTYGTDDPMCCPSVKKVIRFVISGMKLLSVK